MAETFGEFMARWRKRSSLSQADVALLLDTSRQTVNAWERGRGSPRRSQIITMLDRYGVPNDERAGLLDGTQ